MNVFDNITQALGNTPIVRLNKIGLHTKATIYAKLEFLNPGGSVKDRMAFQIVSDAEEAGLLKPGGTIVEATSGNTGIGLAMAAAVKGYKCIFVMPDKMAIEKVRALEAFGAKVLIAPTAVEPEDPRSYYSVSKKIAANTPGSFYANQYHNPSNPKGHYLSTGPEIWRQMGSELDVFVSSAGTGGTLSGIGRFLKERNSAVQIVAADPIGSVYFDYHHTGKLPPAYSYKVEGFGEDFIPSTMDFTLVDDVIRVTDRECFDYAHRLVQEEGIYTSGSSGGSVAACVKYAERHDRPMNILTLMTDGAGNYLNKVFNNDWLTEHGYSGALPTTKTIAQLLELRGPQKLVTISLKDSVKNAIIKLKTHNLRVLPVVCEGQIMGVLNEQDLLSGVMTNLTKNSNQLETAITSYVSNTFAILDPRDMAYMLPEFFAKSLTVLIKKGSQLITVFSEKDYLKCHMK